MISRRTFVLTAVAIAVAGLCASALATWSLYPGAARTSTAAWKELHGSLTEMVERVDVIAFAEAAGTSPSRSVRSADGNDTLPFEKVEFRVLDGVKGISHGDSLRVERVGGTDHAGNVVYIDADGGAFEEGSRYLLFLKRQEEGPHFYQVHGEARYRLEGERLKAVVPEGRIAAEIHNRTLAEVLERIRASLN